MRSSARLRRACPDLDLEALLAGIRKARLADDLAGIDNDDDVAGFDIEAADRVISGFQGLLLSDDCFGRGNEKAPAHPALPTRARTQRRVPGAPDKSRRAVAYRPGPANLEAAAG